MGNSLLPKFESYGNYSGRNYGAHALRFQDVEGRSYWFSYQTLVALYVPDRGKIVSENCWGPTTGKHLNAIDGGDKQSRISRDQFERIALEWLGTVPGERHAA